MNQFKLSESSKPEGFNAPNGYFDNFEDKIMSRIESDKSVSETKIIGLKKYRNWFTAAAAILVIALGTTLYLKSQNQNSFSDEVIESYLLAHQSNYDLFHEMELEDIQSMKTEVSADDAAIEDYLLEQDQTTHLLLE